MIQPTNSDPHSLLMIRVCAGEEDAFAMLVDSIDKRLAHFLYRRLGNDPLIEDLKQEVFLRIYRARHSYQPRAAFCTWMYTIANNLVRNELRRRRRRPNGFSSTGQTESFDVADTVISPPNSALRKELGDHLRAVLELLPERQCRALQLYYFEHQSYTEIGHALNCSRLAVKSLLNRARGALRQNAICSQTMDRRCRAEQ